MLIHFETFTLQGMWHTLPLTLEKSPTKLQSIAVVQSAIQEYYYTAKK